MLGGPNVPIETAPRCRGQPVGQTFSVSGSQTVFQEKVRQLADFMFGSALSAAQLLRTDRYGLLIERSALNVSGA